MVHFSWTSRGYFLSSLDLLVMSFWSCVYHFIGNYAMRLVRDASLVMQYLVYAMCMSNACCSEIRLDWDDLTLL